MNCVLNKRHSLDIASKFVIAIYDNTCDTNECGCCFVFLINRCDDDKRKTIEKSQLSLKYSLQ